MTITIGATGADEIVQNVEIIISTPKGSVPLDRNFGLDYSVVDQPIPIAKALLAAQVVETLLTYEPRVRITEVTFDPEFELNGVLRPVVQFEPVESEGA